LSALLRTQVPPLPEVAGNSVYPAAGPYNAENNSNAIDTDPNIQHQNEYNVRIDHTFGQKDSVWFRYSRINSTVTVPAGLPGLIKNEAIPGRNWGASYIHTFSPSLQLQALFSRTTVADNSTTKFAGLDAQTIDQAAGFSPDFASNFAGTPGWLIPSLGPGNGIASAGESVQIPIGHGGEPELGIRRGDKGVNGLLVPVDDAPALAAAIGRLIADPALKARLIERGRADYQRGFTREAVTRRMIALYTEIIAEHRGAGAAAAGERA
jgi:hypothetical protein